MQTSRNLCFQGDKQNQELKEKKYLKHVKNASKKENSILSPPGWKYRVPLLINFQYKMVLKTINFYGRHTACRYRFTHDK